jgi:hypothetical protein
MATHRMPTDLMDTAQPESRTENDSPQPFLNILFSGWNPDLPDPGVLMHLVDIFFKCDPCGSRILHKPSFMASLRFHPKDQGFPHSALLHAVVRFLVSNDPSRTKCAVCIGFSMGIA